jgi:hypothetical protein
MHTLSQRMAPGPTLASLVASLFLLGAARGDEAVLPNGKRLQGELSSAGGGRLLFHCLGRQTVLPLDQLHHVNFPPRHSPPLRAAAPYRVVLRDDQRLTGELLDLDKDKVKLRTASCGTIVLPRAAVGAVTQLPGFVTVFLDDLEREPKSWRLKGAAALSTAEHFSGRHSLCLAGPGQAEYTLPAPLAAGRAGISFYNDAQAGGSAWQIGAEFTGSAAWPLVRARLDPLAGSFTAEVSGAAAAKGRLPGKGGWQRLDIEFDRDRLVLAIDDDILLACRQPASGGALRKVRLSCTGSRAGTRPGGGVYFDDFSLAKAVPLRKHPQGDPEQDEIWLVSGDQLFGNVIDAKSNEIHLRALFGPRTIPWGDARGIYFRLHDLPTRKPDRNGVRIWLNPGTGFEPDILEGSVLLLDPHRLVLRHEVLGELQIDRKRLKRLQALTE